MRLALVVALLLATAPAHADSRIDERGIQKTGPEEWPGKHELSAHIGYQINFGGAVGDPSGFKLVGEYAYRFQRIAWFDVQASQLFGAGARTDPCRRDIQALCYRGGWASGLAVGIKLKIPTKIPVVVEVPVLLGIQGIYNRECGDDGVAAPIVRTGAGVKYFIKRWVGVGAGVDIDLGPTFHDATSCRGGGRYTDLYGSFDIHVGAEFIL